MIDEAADHGSYVALNLLHRTCSVNLDGSKLFIGLRILKKHAYSPCFVHAF